MSDRTWVRLEGLTLGAWAGFVLYVVVEAYQSEPAAFALQVLLFALPLVLGIRGFWRFLDRLSGRWRPPFCAHGVLPEHECPECETARQQPGG